MNLSVVTPPAVEPLTLAEARAHLRDPDVRDDALISGYVMAAREHVEDYTSRAIVSRTYDLKIARYWPTYLDDCGERRVGIVLPRPPLSSVTSITYVDSAGDSQTLAADQYQVTHRYGEVRHGLIVPAYSVTWPTLRDIPDAITVRFVAGYGTLEAVPNRIRQAMLLLVGHWYENREEVVTGTIVTRLPAAVEDLLFPFVVF